MGEKNISVLLFYNPGQLGKKGSTMKIFDKGWRNYNNKYFFGFVLQLHFDLVDVKNHFNAMNGKDQRVGLDSKISTIRSAYRSGGNDDENQDKISSDIKQSLRKGKGPATPTLASNINCMCYNHDQVQYSGARYYWGGSE